MQSDLPKPLHLLGGKPLLAWVLDASSAAGTHRQIVITPKSNHNIDDFIAKYNTKHSLDIETYVQHEPKGTGHAVECTADALKGYEGVVIVAFADTPLIYTDTYSALANALHDDPSAAIACLGFTADDPTGYGRMVMARDGMLVKIIEEKDANAAEKRIDFVNAGIMALRAPDIFKTLDQILFNNSGEKYLTDCIEAVRKNGQNVLALTASPAEVMGINNRTHLAKAEAILQARFRTNAMQGGATLIAPETVFLNHDTVLERDVIIAPNVVFGAGVSIGQGSEVRSFSHLEDTITGACCIIGPYARLRGGARLGDGVKIGNFVEVKNTVMGDLTKASHLSYLGDADIGAKVNIGAGTVTCNYDGIKKHKTEIDAGAFIGSNTSLIAPISVGAGAVIGAGSTISRNVKSHDIALTRAEMKTVSGGATRLRKKQGKPQE